MRFVELDLLAFGPFSDVAIDLSQGDCGLHVIYGPNEAGKSAALRAIRAVLFGIPHQSSDNFLHDYKQLRIGARLQNAAGDELPIVRRKGRSSTLLNPEHAQEAAYPDQALDPFLRGADDELFTRVYGINHAELVRGGNELRTLKGLVGESLFAAGLGGAALAEVLAKLDSDGAELYRKSGKPAIKVAAQQYKEALKEKRRSEVSASRWQSLQRDLQQSCKRRDEVVQKLKDLRTTASRLERFRSALKWIAERARVQRKLEEIGDVVVLPEEYSVEERSRCQTELLQCQKRREALQEKLDGDGGLRFQIAEIKIPDGLLEHAAIITRLQKRLGAILKASEDTGKLQLQKDQKLTDAQRLLRELGLDESWDSLHRLRIPSDSRVAIQNLANDARRLRDMPGDLATQRDELEASVKQAEAELQSLGKLRESGELHRQVEAARASGDLESELSRNRQQLSLLETEADRALSALGLWHGALAELVRLPVPLPETVERFEREQSQLSEQLRHLQSTAAERSEELAKVQQSISALEQTESVPTEAELDITRGQRDRQWKTIRAAWLDGAKDEAVAGEFAGEVPLAEAYEQNVVRADNLADRLRREADRVAKLAADQARSARLGEQLADLEARIQQIRQQQATLDEKWCELWSSAEISQPLPPREMRGWLEQRSNLTQLSCDIDEKRAKATELQREIAEHVRQVSECLVQLDEPSPQRDGLETLLARAKQVINHIDEANRRREQLQREMARCRAEHNKCTEAHKHAVSDLESWQLKWRDAMNLLGCPAEAPAEQANERMSRLDELFKHVDQVEQLEARILAIDKDSHDFESEVSSLVLRLAPDLSELPPTEAAAQLQFCLDQAQTDKVRRDHLLESQESDQREVEECRQQEIQLKQRLDQLCEVAGVETPDALADVERSSSEISKLIERQCEVDDQLLALGDGLSIDELTAEAGGLDGDGLAAEIAQLRDEIENLEDERDQVVAQVREHENECAAIDGSAAAAEADQRALEILARMHADIERYLQLKLAASILRHQIEQHRAENQDPLLSRASDLFSRLTGDQFAGIRTEYDDADQPVIVGVRRGSNEVLHVEAMSEGTRDQLYLSLRLAYLQRHLSQHEPLPFVVDDILINFDDDRALATLEVLSELSSQTQVIFFTHHRRLVEIAEGHVSPRDLFVHTLPGPHERDGQPAVSVTSGAKRPR